jgi:hypothetical protein
MGARYQVGKGVVVPVRQATQPGGNGSLESIFGLLKSLKIRAQVALSSLAGDRVHGVIVGDVTRL